MTQRKGKKREKTVQVCGKGMGKDSVGCAYLEKGENRVEFVYRGENVPGAVFL